MKTFYSILYCPIRPVVDEKLSIALLVRTDQAVFFRYSHDKLKVIKDLLPAPAYNLLKSSLRSIDDYFTAKSTIASQSPLLFGNSEVHTEKFLQPDYFNYLNDYTNNLLHFSKPKTLDLQVTEKVFDSLYFKLIFDADLIIEKKRLLVDKVYSKVNPRIKSRVNLNVELTSGQISHLVIPTPVWFIGKNDREVTGEVIDFNKPTHNLENDVRDYLYVLQSLRDSKRNQAYGKHFLVGNEPAKGNDVNHSIWTDVRKLSYLSFISPKETDVITNYVHEHNVSPFFLEEETGE